ncbi:MAG: methyltransferase [Patescibacteria group bacterium]|nr:methyltransferase [Patescibacteria group bacterium]MBU2509453.1 methyltransferase [Patescibacteria group bacterium]
MAEFKPHNDRGLAKQCEKLSKKQVTQQLDVFAKEHGIKSLRDRLRIGLNEVGVLAVEQTNSQVIELCKKLANNKEEAEMIYQNLVDMCVDIQQHGPWEYATEFKTATSPEIKAWFMLQASESMGYEKEMDLTDREFLEDVGRITSHLTRANKHPESFFEEALEHVIGQAESKIRFDKKDKDELIPIGDGLGTFLPMAIKGYEVGVSQDAEGWVYVGARGRISDGLIESCGLTKKVTEDPRDPTRKVTLFTNKMGQDVVKKVHRGFLVILSKSFDLAGKIAQAVRDENTAVNVTEEAVTHTRVIQTSEGNRDEVDPEEERKQWERKQFLRIPNHVSIHEGTPGTNAMSRPREEFYERMLYIRAMYVYLDSIIKFNKELKKSGVKRDITEYERQVVSERTWNKMEQKVDELRYVNELIAEHPDMMPTNVRSVVDMAGGAGDLGLAIGSDLLAQGREIENIEIVDPQPGVADFMHNIIDYLPFREDLEKVAHHNGGYLQDAHIRPDAAVVAKHACGTLTDDTIKLWSESESPVLIAMTCCQDKAKDHPALYGFTQKRWHNLCVMSSLTNTEIPEDPGTARDIAIKKLQMGKEAMYELDMARVEYLRRHGFKAELYTTDKFPKGDVVMARRLPKGFMDKLEEFEILEKESPKEFDAKIMRLDRLARGKGKKAERSVFGAEWVDDDFAELVRRLSPAEQAHQQEMKERQARAIADEYRAIKAEDRKKKIEAEEKARKKEIREKKEILMSEVFHDVGGKPNTYLDYWSTQTKKKIPKKDYGNIMRMINEVIMEDFDADPKATRAKIDRLMEINGYKKD